MQTTNIFWFRRDLRLEDNAGLYHALKNGQTVLPIFIFDTNILDKLTDRQDARVQFLYDAVSELKTALEAMGSTLLVFYGKPEVIWQEITQQFEVQAVYTNHDYEPYAKERDAHVQKILAAKNIDFHSFKDHVIFEQLEVAKDDGTPYTVFTPYSRKWKAKLDTKWAIKNASHNYEARTSYYLQSYPTELYYSHFLKRAPAELIPLAQMGFEATTTTFPSKSVTRKRIRHYDETRDFPAIEGTSRLGIHFRFGTISIREKARHARVLNETYLNELIWRDFYAMILANFPQVVGAPFRAKYQSVEWRNNETEFELWCQGKTGYPMVDAGMRQLNETGYMHNRVRMVVASFLTKHLLIDWRWGEAYFAQKLLDFDLASNNGGWQWAAGCGTDAAPYFRIFNPASQQKKFDKNGTYIQRWVPEYGTPDYPTPIVDHKEARERCLKVYKEGLAAAAVSAE